MTKRARSMILRRETRLGIGEQILPVFALGDSQAYWQCRVWDTTSGDEVAEATLLTSRAAREWLAAVCGGDGDRT